MDFVIEQGIGVYALFRKLGSSVCSVNIHYQHQFIAKKPAFGKAGFCTTKLSG
jgi:hypothetical protein